MYAIRSYYVTLDIEMPKMNGIDFLKKLIPQYPIPVVVVSALPIQAFEALDAGAVDFVKKPTVKGQEDLKIFSLELREKIKIARRAKVTGVKTNKQVVVPKKSYDNISHNQKTIIAIGASTGGTDAIQDVIQNLPETIPPIIITQHMPPKFTEMFAQRLNRVSKIEVREAKDGDRLKSGLALIAAGDYHLRLAKDSRITSYNVCYTKLLRVFGLTIPKWLIFSLLRAFARKFAIFSIEVGCL